MREQYILYWSVEPFHNKDLEFKNFTLKFNGFDGTIFQFLKKTLTRNPYHVVTTESLWILFNHKIGK